MPVTSFFRLSRIYQSLPRDRKEPFMEVVRNGLGLGCDVTGGDLALIPKSGPLVIVANHPFGAAEGIVLARILGAVRGDVRVLANHLLERIPELKEDFIFVDPFRPGASPENFRGMRRALAHVANGGALATFPAGAVSHFHLDRMIVTDQPWSPAIARLVRRTKATVLPVYFPGANGPLFQLAGLLHPSLRTALLPQALLDRRYTRIELRIGRPIAFSRLAHLESDEAMITHLRRRTYVLAQRGRGEEKLRGGAPPAMITPPRPAATLAREIAALPEESVLASAGELDVILTTADRVPNVVQEIGRMREITFRAAGEGSGRSIDLDAHDMYYKHLFLWNREKQELVGAYRIGVVDAIVNRYGVAGLYTSSLFRYSSEFFAKLGSSAVELGRSWVRPEYQKSYAPLLLLWRGLGAFAARNPQCCVLFGPASISNEYSVHSRALLAGYLMRESAAHDLVPLVQPRSRFRPPRSEAHASQPNDLEEVQELLQEIENGRRSVPVLLRQYLNVGGRVAALNVDRNFSDVLDALVVVDLRRTPEKLLSRYMTPDGARAFLGYHAKRAEVNASPKPAANTSMP